MADLMMLTRLIGVRGSTETSSEPEVSIGSSANEEYPILVDCVSFEAREFAVKEL
jgi:hypothetical protein